MRAPLFSRVLAAAILGLVSVAPAKAAVFLAMSGSTVPIGDTDGVTGIADIDWTDNSNLHLDVVYRNIAGDMTGGLAGTNWGLRFSLLDVAETNPATGSFTVSPAVINLGTPFTPTSLDLAWSTGAGALADNTVILSLRVSTRILGTRPHDDLGDLRLAGAAVAIPGGGPASAVGVLDPIAGTVGAFADYDLQKVPAPVPAALLFSAFAALAGLGRRRT